MTPWQNTCAILADRYAVVARDRKRGPSHADAKAIRAEIIAIRVAHGGSDTALDDALAAESRKAILIEERSKALAASPKRRRAVSDIRTPERPRPVDVAGPNGTERQCIKCHRVQPLDNYQPTTTGNRRGVCTDCRNEQKRARDKCRREARKAAA